MGIITRAEATHRLKIISSTINNASSAARDGNWSRSREAADEAMALLSSILPHLEEASNDGPSNAVAPLSDEAKARIGGMGYRGSSHSPRSSRKNPIVSSNAPPAPIPVPQPIITPPPENTEPVRFDLSRIANRPEFLAQFSQIGAGAIAPLTAEELEQSKIFNNLPVALQSKIAAEYNKTGNAVYVRLKKSK